MDCANLMKALGMRIYCASVAAKLSIHGFKSPLILIKVIDHNASEDLLNPSGQKQLHMTNFTPTLKTVRHSFKVAFVGSWTAIFKIYPFAQFLVYSSLFDFDFNKNIVWYDDKRIHQEFSYPLKTLTWHMKEKIKWRRKNYSTIRSQVPWKEVGI